MNSDSPQIKAIKERYRSSFPEKLDTLHELVSIVEEEGDINFVREELHKLAGSSGMYGYDDISFVCREAMQSADDKQFSKLNTELAKICLLLESAL